MTERATVRRGVSAAEMHILQALTAVRMADDGDALRHLARAFAALRRAQEEVDEEPQSSSNVAQSGMPRSAATSLRT